MILECDHCYNRIVIRADEPDARILFCPVCGEPTDDDDLEDNYNFYDDYEE